MFGLDDKTSSAFCKSLPLLLVFFIFVGYLKLYYNNYCYTMYSRYLEIVITLDSYFSNFGDKKWKIISAINELFKKSLFSRFLPWTVFMILSTSNASTFSIAEALWFFVKWLLAVFAFAKNSINDLQGPNRRSPPKVLVEKGVLKICSNFTREHPFRSLILMKLLCKFAGELLLS